MEISHILVIGANHRIQHMRKVLLIIVIFLTTNIVAQDNYNEFYKRKGDSIIISIVGIDNFEKFFEFQTYSHYQYSTRKGKLKTATYEDKLKKNISIKKYYVWYLLKIDSLDYQYLFVFKITNDNLNTFKTQIKGIPKYLIEQKKCNIIRKSQAIEIAVQNNLKNIDTNWIANLRYNSDLDEFTWTVIGSIELLNLKPSYSAIINYIEINAVTKKIVLIQRKIRVDQVH